MNPFLYGLPMLHNEISGKTISYLFSKFPN